LGFDSLKGLVGSSAEENNGIPIHWSFPPIPGPVETAEREMEVWNMANVVSGLWIFGQESH
jgi:hypothetical protein